MLDQSQRAAALERLRELSGLSRRAAARRIGVTTAQLRSWETRESTPTTEQLEWALAVYGRDLERLLAPREDLVSPATPGTLTVGSHSIDTDSIRQRSADSSSANRQIVSEYLAAVRSEREVAADAPIALRSVDLSQLAAELDLTDEHLSDLLASELNLTGAGAQLVTRAVIVAGLMSLTAMTAFGGGWFKSNSTVTSATPSATRVLDGPTSAEAVPGSLALGTGGVVQTRALSPAPVEGKDTDVVPASEALPAVQVAPNSEVTLAGSTSVRPDLFAVEGTSGNSVADLFTTNLRNAGTGPVVGASVDSRPAFSVDARRTLSQ